jgi:hypothetical protein
LRSCTAKLGPLLHAGGGQARLEPSTGGGHTMAWACRRKCGNEGATHCSSAQQPVRGTAAAATTLQTMSYQLLFTPAPAGGNTTQPTGYAKSRWCSCQCFVCTGAQAVTLHPVPITHPCNRSQARCFPSCGTCRCSCSGSAVLGCTTVCGSHSRMHWCRCHHRRSGRPTRCAAACNGRSVRGCSRGGGAPSSILRP